MPRADEPRRGATSDAAHCEHIVRGHARTFTLASYLLPAEKRRAAFALYAFCRVADDIVDADVGADEALVATRLAEYDRQLSRALAGRPAGPVFRELHRVVREYSLPGGVLHELVDGVARDLRPVRYRSWTELALYCEGVASTVGEMCTYVFGVGGDADARARALRYARALGVAMQLTNILRDVGEDARRGRCYLPDEDLARFSLTRGEVMAAAREAAPVGGAPSPLARDARWRALVAFQIGRARAIYAAAMPGVGLLARDAQRCAAACAWGYAGILGAIEANDYDTLGYRARLGGWARVSVLWDAWRARPTARAIAIAEGPVLEWDGAAGRVEGDELLRWA